MSATSLTTLAKTQRRFATDQQRWQAVLQRDRSAGSEFVYAVKTTGVYCRPACPARLPRRDHVCFHDSSISARRAGFRPCKRCRPDDASFAQQHVAAVEQACRIIQEADHAPGLETLAAAVGLSPSHFHRVFKSITGLTPKEFANAHRAQRLRNELTRGSTAARTYAAGFQSAARFYATSKKSLGMPPATFRSGGADALIRFAVGQCSLGAILVAASEMGVCEIALGDDPSKLVHALNGRFPKAQLAAGDAQFEKLVTAAIGLVECPAAGIELPLDIQGTVLQQRVWKLLRDIPCGKTITYTELAKRLGKPKAVRAVASACAANKIAVAIPCHRVVRTDGSISGYRWGVKRKKTLLEREASGPQE